MQKNWSFTEKKQINQIEEESETYVEESLQIEDKDDRREKRAKVMYACYINEKIDIVRNRFRFTCLFDECRGCQNVYPKMYIPKL